MEIVFQGELAWEVTKGLLGHPMDLLTPKKVVRRSANALQSLGEQIRAQPGGVLIQNLLFCKAFSAPDNTSRSNP